MSKKLIVWAALSLVVLMVCRAEDAATGGEASKEDLSYAVGVLLGRDFKKSDLKLDYAVLAEAMRRTIESEDAGMTDEAAALIVRGALQSAQEGLRKANLEKSAAFLAENALRSGVRVTESGLHYELVEQGNGARAARNMVARVKYTGSLIDGTVFDRNADEEAGAEIPLSQVIPGFAEGVALMNVGGRAKLFIPPPLAYGEEGAGEDIPPNSVLVFDVELLGVEEP
ncbi:MAG: FKBP-type peptidyl-prolyl cis-trans isomerase [Spirochaetaceae bacterium]|jgi:FKBP-type peptidyl-prolyl cis-trans isomerase|nr:FKBP-type peptidyl-prolyl cis-trans isomerase [Spirochaetaceae bacterium]